MFNDEMHYEQKRLQNNYRCKGSCHDIPNMGNREILNKERSLALANGTFSTIVAIGATVGCGISGTTCFMAPVLGADAARQFTIASTGQDPVIQLALSVGYNELQAKRIGVVTTYITTLLSARVAYHGILSLSGQNIGVGVGGMGVVDAYTIPYSVGQLPSNGND